MSAWDAIGADDPALLLRIHSRSFAGSKARYAVEEFLEGVDTTSLRAKDPNENSTAEPDELPTNSQHKALGAHSTSTRIS